MNAYSLTEHLTNIKASLEQAHTNLRAIQEHGACQFTTIGIDGADSRITNAIHHIEKIREALATQTGPKIP
jgi:hypothetical protein